MTLLINPGSFSVGLNEATQVPPIGLLYIAGILNKNGFQAEVFDAGARKNSFSEALRLVEIKRPVVIGLRVYYYNITWARELIKGIRKVSPDTIIGIGGDCASYNPVKIIEKTGADFAVSGEGEMPMLAIIRNIASKKQYYEDVPGITAAAQSGSYYSGPENKRINDLDLLPFPDYSLIGGLAPYSTRTKFSPAAPIMTTRGCPFKCSFCAKNVFKSLVTYRSAENVIQEIISLKNKYGIRQVDILDDNFTVNKAYLEKILDLIIKEKLGLSFDLRSGVRVESLDEEILKKMIKAGFYKIAFGIESADKAVLDLCHKQLDLKKLKEIAILAKKLSFRTFGFFIIGLPNETRESVKQTIKLAREIKLDVANFCMATPYPGTELYDYVKKHGNFLFDPEGNYDFGFYGGRPFYELPGLSQNEVSYRFSFAYRSFYNIFKVLKDLFSIRSFAELKWFLGAAFSVLKGQMYNLFRFPGAESIRDLDAPEATELHRSIIQKKPFLKRLYRDWYHEFNESSSGLPLGARVELGSGGGFIKEVIPQAYTSDIILLSGLDLNLSVLNLPFKDNSVSAFFILNSLHHVNNVAVFFEELARCLKEGGRIIMIEPANTLWSRFIFSNFHHEDFDLSGGWDFASRGPLSSANGALPWIVFSRDRDIFIRKFPQLKINRMHCHAPLRYLLSGGFSLYQIVPSFTYSLFKCLEFLISPLNKYLGMFLLIEVEKCKKIN